MATQRATPAWPWPCSAERAITLETGRADRVANMEAFAKRALELLDEAVAAAA